MTAQWAEYRGPRSHLSAPNLDFGARDVSILVRALLGFLVLLLLVILLITTAYYYFFYYYDHCAVVVDYLLEEYYYYLLLPYLLQLF